MQFSQVVDRWFFVNLRNGLCFGIKYIFLMVLCYCGTIYVSVIVVSNRCLVLFCLFD